MSIVFARPHKVVTVIIISIVITVIVIIIFVVFLVSLSLLWHSRRWLLPCQVSSICPTSCGFVLLPAVGYFCDRQVPSVPQAVVLFYSLVTSVTGKTHLSHKPWFCFTPSYWRGRDHDDRENDVIPSDTPEGPHIEPVCDALADYTAVRLELHINVSTWSHLFPPTPLPTLPPSPSHKINF